RSQDRALPRPPHRLVRGGGTASRSYQSRPAVPRAPPVRAQQRQHRAGVSPDGQGRMKQAQLIPKRRKRKRQPTASMYREQLRLAADEIIRLRTERDWMNRHMVAGAWRFPIGIPGEAHPPLWRRLWNRLRARVVETDPQIAAEQRKLR